MNKSLKFIEKKPTRCDHRYARIPGKSSTFLAKADGRIAIKWYRSDVEILECIAAPDPAIEAMGQAINALKQEVAGSPGGAFQINEYGQVLVPASSRAVRYWVGTLKGVPTFVEPTTDRAEIRLDGDGNHSIGSPWSLPYLGMPYVMPADGRYFFWRNTDDGKMKIRPPVYDEQLVQAFQRVRGGSGRFIVNPHGLVLTKREADEQAVFVYKLDLTKWYPKLS